MWEGLKAIDWLGTIALIPASVLFLLGLQMGGVDYAWTSPIILSFLLVGILIGVIFVIIEWKVAKYPLMPLRTFTNRTNIAALGVACFHSMTLVGSSFFLPLYFQGVLGASSLLSGVYILPFALSLTVVNCLTGLLVRLTGTYVTTMRISTLLMALGFGLLIDLPPSYNWAKLIVYQLITGTGIGPNFQCPLVALQASTPQADHAAASSTFNFFRNLSASIAVVVSTAIFQNEMQSQHDGLALHLSTDVVDLLTGANAAANIDVIGTLPETARVLVQLAFLKAMLGIWIMFVILAAAAFVCSLFVRSYVLSEVHKMTETGLEVEEAKRVL